MPTKSIFASTTFWAIVMLLFCMPAMAQTAKVIQLDAKDSQQAKEKWDALQKAQADWDAEKQSIKEKYVLVKQDDPDKGNESIWLNGRGNITVYTTSCASGGESCLSPEERQKRKADEDAHYRYYRSGFENGFQLSKDFKFVVPDAPPPPKYPSPYSVAY